MRWDGEAAVNAMPEAARGADERVVVNHEEQYSVWPASEVVPAGWRDAGFVGTREECLAWISCVWTDMRPLSLRVHLDT